MSQREINAALLVIAVWLALNTISAPFRATSNAVTNAVSGVAEAVNLPSGAAKVAEDETVEKQNSEVLQEGQ